MGLRGGLSGKRACCTSMETRVPIPRAHIKPCVAVCVYSHKCSYSKVRGRDRHPSVVHRGSNRVESQDCL